MLQRQYKHIIVVGVDGAGAFIEKASTPFTDKIFEHGAKIYSALSSRPTISGECWGSMLTGTSPLVHGLDNGKASSVTYDVHSEFPTVFRRIRAQYPKAVLASFCNWNPINYGIVEHSLGVAFDTGEDEYITEHTCKYIKRFKPDFMFIHLDSVDGAGHRYGYGTDGHIAQIHKADEMIGQIYSAVCEAGISDDTLFLCIADHGGTPPRSAQGGGGHGGWTRGERLVFFFASGKGVKKGEIPEMNIRDLAAIVLYGMGIEAPKRNPKGWTSQIPAELFEGDFPEYIPYIPEFSSRETLPERKRDEKGYLTDYIAPNKIRCVLEFNGNAFDSSESYKTECTGIVKYYNNGVVGRCAEVGNAGYITVNDLLFENKSFTVGVWVKVESDTPGEPIIFTNRQYSPKRSDGIDFGFMAGGLGVKVCIKGETAEYRDGLTENFTDGWVHELMVFNREENTITLYSDFKPLGTYALPRTAVGASLDFGAFCIGNDAQGGYNRSIFMLDDFIVLDGVLTDNEVKSLAEYYKTL